MAMTELTMLRLKLRMATRMQIKYEVRVRAIQQRIDTIKADRLSAKRGAHLAMYPKARCKTEHLSLAERQAIQAKYVMKSST